MNRVNAAAVRVSLSCCAIIASIIFAGCPPPSQPLFSFAVLADLHLSGNPDHEARVSASVDWINTHSQENLIELVVIAGDIGWGSGQLATARQLLDGLTMPYIPLIGDNEVQTRFEQDFDTTFAPHYAYLATVLGNWRKSPTPVWNPEIGEYSYFQNLSFDHRGVHFVGIDWAPRVIGPPGDQQAELHDFPGGTWQWFTEDITSCNKAIRENIVMMSHHAMHANELGAFSAEEDARLELFTQGFGNNVYASLAGHFHFNWYEYRSLGLYEVFVTDATWDDENTIRIVKVSSDGTAFAYEHQLVTVP